MVYYSSNGLKNSSVSYFGDYFNSFDLFHPIMNQTHSINGQDVPNVQMSNFATTANPTRDPLEELTTKIKEGATALELGFTGQGKGMVGQGQTTPGSFGENERQAIRRMADENKVRLSTHASITLTGFSGLTRDRDTYGWKFDDIKRIESEKEVEQTIDFAADTAKGGAIVIHAGEFFRDIANTPGNFGDKKKGYFESFTGQHEKIKEATENEEEGKFHFRMGRVAREDTGEINKVYRDMDIPIKKEQWNALSGKLNEMQNEINNINSSNFTLTEKDTEIRKIKKEYDEQINKVMFDFEQIYKDDDKKTLRESIYKNGESELDVGKDSAIKEIHYAEVLKTLGFDYGEADKLFYRIRHAQELNAKKAEISRYNADYEESRDDLEDLKKAKEIQLGIEEDTPESERWKLKKKSVRQQLGRDMGLIPDKYEMPSEFLEKQIKEKEERLTQMETAILNSKQQVNTLDKELGSESNPGTLKSIEELGLDNTAKTISDLGLHALKKWKELKENKEELLVTHQIDRTGKSEKEVEKELDEHALYVAPENMMPDHGAEGEPFYGGHPQELKKIILKSREEMVQKLMNPDKGGVRLSDYGFNNYDEKISQSEAEELAARHIKATFDIGHANTWRKFFHGVDPKEAGGKDENEQFKDWLSNQVQDLLDDNIIGHVHITDNFGYADDHISPGEGGSKRGAPIGDFVKRLLEAEKDNKKIKEPWIVEAGHQGVNVLFNTWRQMGHPIYRLGNGMPGPSFGFMENSYLSAGYSSKVFNDSSLGPGQNRQVGWSGAPLI
ncbi:MAG: hypothetical protein WC755_05280 [Candidatus Woesearchaeota archaeon]|jgi:hypothetical protein